MSKGIKKQIIKARENVLKEIHQSSSSHVQRGLASEGYAGGYLDALDDVELALNGIYNNNSRYWKEEQCENK